MLDFTAEANGAAAKMGGSLHPAAGATISLHIRAVAASGSSVHVLLDGEESMPGLPLVDGMSTTVTAGAGRHWLRLEVRDQKGGSELIGSPLYLNFPED